MIRIYQPHSSLYCLLFFIPHTYVPSPGCKQGSSYPPELSSLCYVWVIFEEKHPGTPIKRGSILAASKFLHWTRNVTKHLSNCDWILVSTRDALESMMRALLNTVRYTSSAILRHTTRAQRRDKIRTIDLVPSTSLRSCRGGLQLQAGMVRAKLNMVSTYQSVATITQITAPNTNCSTYFDLKDIAIWSIIALLFLSWIYM